MSITSFWIGWLRRGVLEGVDIPVARDVSVDAVVPAVVGWIGSNNSEGNGYKFSVLIGRVYPSLVLPLKIVIVSPRIIHSRWCVRAVCPIERTEVVVLAA